MNHAKKLSVIAIMIVCMLVFSTSFASAGLWDYIRSKITGKVPYSNINLNISVGNTPPNVTFVESFGPIDIIENGLVPVVFAFYVNDSDGSANIKGAMANFSNGTTTITNTSCVAGNTLDSYSRNFSCTLNIPYFYANKTNWNIGIAANDTSDGQGFNTTKTFVLSGTRAIMGAPSILSFPQINPGATNTKSNNDPHRINNTGNVAVDDGKIRVNATGLFGESDNSYVLYAENFSVTPTDSCGEINMSNSTYVSITGATLPSGNYSLGGGIAQEDLYVCLNWVDNGIKSQSYSTDVGIGPWTITVFDS